MIIYNGVGAETLANPGIFFPADGTVLMTFVWTADPGNVSFTYYQLGTAETVDIFINGGLPGEKVISLDGRMIGEIEEIPIPGAVYLLASGLLGLVGLRRKMS